MPEPAELPPKQKFEHDFPLRSDFLDKVTKTYDSQGEIDYVALYQATEQYVYEKRMSSQVANIFTATYQISNIILI